LEISGTNTTVLYVVTAKGEFVVPVSVHHFYKDIITERKYTGSDFIAVRTEVYMAYNEILDIQRAMRYTEEVDLIIREDSIAAAVIAANLEESPYGDFRIGGGANSIAAVVETDETAGTNPLGWIILASGIIPIALGIVIALKIRKNKK
jgi:hypothetical protein